MSTNILNVSVPDAPTPSMEMCHEFTFNFLFQIIFRGRGIFTPYIQNMTYPHLYHLLLRIGKQYLVPGTPIQGGDILIFSANQTVININPPVTHSMVAINTNH